MFANRGSLIRRYALAIGFAAGSILGGCAGTSTPEKLSQPQSEAAAGSQPPAAGAGVGESQQEWLARLNAYRQAAGLKAVIDNRAQSDGDRKHAQYLVKNYQPGQKFGAEMHQENESNPWFTREGRRAGETSDVIPPSTAEGDQVADVDLWLSGPFHALPMLDPDLTEAGFGRYCQNDVCAAVLNVGRGESWKRKQALVAEPIDSDSGNGAYTLTNPARVFDRPVEFPPPDSTISSGQFNGMEWPNPLSACPGYAAPTGAIVLISFGSGFDPQISDASVATGGKPLDTCLVTAQNYKGPDETQTKAAKGNLHLYAAAFLVPREPLQTGAKYDVSVTKDGQTYAWSFIVQAKSPVSKE